LRQEEGPMSQTVSHVLISVLEQIGVGRQLPVRTTDEKPMKGDRFPEIEEVATEPSRVCKSACRELAARMACPFFSQAHGAAEHLLLSPGASLCCCHPSCYRDRPARFRAFSRADPMSSLLRAMGAFLVKVAAHLNLTRLQGVDRDVGALAFLFAAADHPGLFESLALGGAATRVDLAGGRLKDIIASRSGAFAAIDGANTVSNYPTQVARITPPAIIDDFRRASAGRRFADAAQYVRAYKEDLPLLEQRLARIQTPVLVIAGKNDPIVPPANNQFLADRLPRNRLSVLEAAQRAWQEPTEPYSREIMSWFGG